MIERGREGERETGREGEREKRAGFLRVWKVPSQPATVSSE